MKKEVVVISLGGSVIIPKEIDHSFLKEFKKTIRKNLDKFRFVIVCGGGIIARKYIRALKKQRKGTKEQALAGIRATRMNAKLMTQLFGKESHTNQTLPKSMKEIKNQLIKNNVVFCGALRYAENETSDGTAAKLAKFFKTDLINISNVLGLYNKNPLKYKDAKFISKISWKDFKNLANKIKYYPGQHFVLDQNAAHIIRKHKIKTFLVGKGPNNLNNLINKKKFEGTIIEG